MSRTTEDRLRWVLTRGAWSADIRTEINFSLHGSEISRKFGWVPATPWNLLIKLSYSCHRNVAPAALIPTSSPSPSPSSAPVLWPGQSRPLQWRRGPTHPTPSPPHPPCFSVPFSFLLPNPIPAASFSIPPPPWHASLLPVLPSHSVRSGPWPPRRGRPPPAT